MLNQGEDMARNSLGLAGDLDGVELVEDIDRAFDIRPPADELTRCNSVGDLFELVNKRLPHGPSKADR